MYDVSTQGIDAQGVWWTHDQCTLLLLISLLLLKTRELFQAHYTRTSRQLKHDSTVQLHVMVRTSQLILWCVLCGRMLLWKIAISVFQALWKKAVSVFQTLWKKPFLCSRHSEKKPFLVFQATFEGWMEIMTDAVDSTFVSAITFFLSACITTNNKKQSSTSVQLKA